MTRVKPRWMTEREYNEWRKQRAVEFEGEYYKWRTQRAVELRRERRF